ncbi:FtsQ-type POTRA domain-containing protein [Candidatus Gottesmanbacteria bacterium]|nr:FtsQ-type POTRA domain-containing protein [Candidatus Gottesmanbacteria bacterium]
MNSIFDIRTIEVISGNVLLSINEKELPRNLLFFPSEKLRIQLLQENPLLHDIQIRKKFPHTLTIEPIQRMGAVRLVRGEQTVVLDWQGVVIPDTDEAVALPKIIQSGEPAHIGQKITDYIVRQSLLFIQHLDARWSVDFVEMRDEESFIVRIGKIDSVISQDADMKVIAATLQTLLEGFRIKGTLPSVVDLRFDKPIVTFN